MTNFFTSIYKQTKQCFAFRWRNCVQDRNIKEIDPKEPWSFWNVLYLACTPFHGHFFHLACLDLALSILIKPTYSQQNKCIFSDVFELVDWYQPSKELKIYKCNKLTVFDQMTLIKRPEKKNVFELIYQMKNTS